MLELAIDFFIKIGNNKENSKFRDKGCLKKEGVSYEYNNHWCG